MKIRIQITPFHFWLRMVLVAAIIGLIVSPIVLGIRSAIIWPYLNILVWSICALAIVEAIRGKS